MLSDAARSCILAVLLAWTVGVDGSDRQPIEMIATVLTEFVHTCTTDQCIRLEAIANDPAATDAERSLAVTLRRVTHRPDYADVRRLRALATDPVQPEEVRTLARMLGRLVHMPSWADRAILIAVLSHEDGQSQ